MSKTRSIRKRLNPRATRRRLPTVQKSLWNWPLMPGTPIRLGVELATVKSRIDHESHIQRRTKAPAHSQLGAIRKGRRARLWLAASFNCVLALAVATLTAFAYTTSARKRLIFSQTFPCTRARASLLGLFGQTQSIGSSQSSITRPGTRAM